MVVKITPITTRCTLQLKLNEDDVKRRVDEAVAEAIKGPNDISREVGMYGCSNWWTSTHKRLYR